MNGKKLLALILALLMLAPILVACKDDKENKKPSSKETGSAQTGGDNDDGPNKEITDYVSELASKVDGNGKTFSFIGRKMEEDGNFPVKEEETGNTVSDAVYARQRDIEDAFGVDWVNVQTEDGDDTQETVTREVMAGTCTYDLVYGHMTSVGQFLLSNGVIQPVDGIPNVDISRDWWVQTLEDTFSIKNKLYFLTGPILVDYFGAGSMILFNKEVAEMFSIDSEELYQTVKDGKWTIDKMLEIASNVPVNSNGSGVYRYLEPEGLEFLFSSGYTITKFDADKVPYLDTTLSIEISDLADKLSNVFGDESQSAFIDHTKGEGYDTIPTKYGVEHMYELFVNNRALFYYGADIGELRKHEVTFGMLPYPKSSETQERYYSYTGSSACVYFPTTISDPALTGAITEAAAALSHVYLREACYEKLLKSQTVFDMESRDMLDIVFDTQISDLAPIYSGGDMNWSGEFITMMDDALKLSSQKFASSYSSQARVSNTKLKQFIKKLDKQLASN